MDTRKQSNTGKQWGTPEIFTISSGELSKHIKAAARSGSCGDFMKSFSNGGIPDAGGSRSKYGFF